MQTTWIWKVALVAVRVQGGQSACQRPGPADALRGVQAPVRARSRAPHATWSWRCAAGALRLRTATGSVQSLSARQRAGLAAL